MSYTLVRLVVKLPYTLVRLMVKNIGTFYERQGDKTYAKKEQSSIRVCHFRMRKSCCLGLLSLRLALLPEP